MIPKPKIVFVGSGNVATHLALALHAAAPRSVAQVISRNYSHAQALAVRIGATPSADIADIDTDADYVVICTSDDAIARVAEAMPRLAHGLILHTSGSVDISALTTAANSVAVMYPLQTFSRDVDVNVAEVPFFTEASDELSLIKVDALASMISKTIIHADSDRRRVLHIAAVIACNFSSYMLNCAERVLASEQLPLSLLKPLVNTSIDKCFDVGPERAQTGPARRADTDVVMHHLDMLSDPQLHNIYLTISKAILQHFHPDNQQLT
ncbi:MAG: Rossmann-like and DUF2520 domain-containing protein [Muribaculaceae bacterium]